MEMGRKGKDKTTAADHSRESAPPPPPISTNFQPPSHQNHDPVKRDQNHTLNAWHSTMLASRAEGDAFTEEDLHLREAVVEGTLQGNVLHGVLYP
jgi:hypothetical protein